MLLVQSHVLMLRITININTLIDWIRSISFPCPFTLSNADKDLSQNKSGYLKFKYCFSVLQLYIKKTNRKKEKWKAFLRPYLVF